MKKKILLFVFLFSGLFSFGQPSAEFNILGAYTYYMPLGGCFGTPLNIDNLSVGAVSYEWSFGDGETSTEFEPTHSYELVATYTITLTAYDEYGLSDTFTKSYRTYQPKADFSITPKISCSAPLTVFYTDESYLPDTWNWNFGDGSSSTAQNPIHTYTTGGLFYVELTVSDTNYGCISSYIDSVMIGVINAEIGGPGFGYFGCGPLTVDFVNASTNIGYGEITDWLWDFGDGTTSDEENPTHLYDEAGTYTVSLTVTNSLGCTSTDVNSSFINVIGPSPSFTADFTSADCPDLTVEFTDESSFSSPITLWEWDFGDGTTSGEISPTHIYSDYGVFDVSLTLSDLDGCSRTFLIEDYISIQDFEDPVFDICPSNQTEFLSADCNFTLPDYTSLATVSDNCTDPLSIVQGPAAGTIITADQLITLSIEDETGNSAECTFNVYLQDNTNPIISCPGDQEVSFDAGCAYTLLDYTGMATASDNCLVPIITQSPSAGTIIAGIVTITLTATDTAGNTAICTFDVIPSDVTAPTITCPSSITVSNDLGECGSIVTYSTPIGLDNCSATTTLITGLASGSLFPIGTITNTYQVIDDGGLTASCSFDITVIDVELPEITCPSPITQNNDAGECGAIISFADIIYSDNCPGIAFSQVEGLASGVLYPVGTTVNEYEVEDVSGNSVACSFEITVIDNEIPTLICPGDIETCESTVIYEDPIYSDNCEISALTLVAGIESGEEFPIGFTINMYDIVDINGNHATCSFNIERFETPVVDAGDDVTTDAGFPIQLNASSSSTGTYNWSPPDGLSDTSQPDPFASPEITTVYTVTLTNNDGCSASDEVQININLKIEINNFMSPNGDGKNDNWEIKGHYLLDACSIKILDSWGNVVYESQGYDNLWNGTIEGEELQQGVYYYVLDCGDGNPSTGSITLIR